MGQRSSPRLGVVLLDSGQYDQNAGTFAPSDEHGLGWLPKGFFESPATWPVPTSFRVAKEATVAATVGGRPEALDGLHEALSELSDGCDLLISDCGFFWQARRAGRAVPGTTLLSGLDLLELAGVMTRQPIGVLTFDGPRCSDILADHPLHARLRIVGVRQQPSWTALGEPDWMTNGRWTVQSLREELVDVLHEAFRSELADVGVVVIECTTFPQFRAEIRELTTVPILDVASVVRGALL